VSVSELPVRQRTSPCCPTPRPAFS